jgi:hypothetical protein
MGRRNRRKLKLVFSLLNLMLCQNYCFSQTKITGIVKNVKNNIISTSIILKDSINNAILDYTYSTDNGFYEFSTKKKEN